MPLLFILVVSNIYASLRDLKPYKMQLWVDLHLNFMSETEYTRMLEYWFPAFWKPECWLPDCGRRQGRGYCESKCTNIQLDVGLHFMDTVHSW
jgi:hypothetical protein